MSSPEKKKATAPNGPKEIKKFAKGTEVPGDMGKKEDGLAHSIVEGNKDKIEQGQILESAMNQGLFAFNPDMMFEQLVRDYNTAEKIYGETMLRMVTGSDSASIKKNINLPEFKRELKQKMNKKIEEMKDDELLGDDNEITERGVELASLTMYMKELDDMRAKGIGEKKQKKVQMYGEKENTRAFKHGDRFQDIALKKSIKTAVRRNHKELEIEDLQVFERDSKGRINVIYGIDASGSMKGKKIEACKKAGVALAFKAIEEKDLAGLIVFGEKIEKCIEPTTDFTRFIKALVTVRAQKQTNIAATIEKAIELFPRTPGTKHLILLTDAAPTAGDNPLKETLDLVERASASGITISLIGIDLDEQGARFAKQIVEIGNGRLYAIKNLENLDRIILEDYYALN